MISGSAKWSSRSILISVKDLNRSIAFYGVVLELDEVLRDEQIAVLNGGEVRPFTLYLRQALRNASRSGQHALGVRSVSWDVGSLDELDQVEARLREADAFRDRASLPDREGLQVVRGYDPDRLALSFVADDSETAMSPEDYRAVLGWMYTMDV